MRFILAFVMFLVGLIGLSSAFREERAVATNIEIKSRCERLSIRSYYFVEVSPVFPESPGPPGPEYDAMFYLSRERALPKGESSAPSTPPDRCEWILLTDREIQKARVWEFSDDWKALEVHVSCAGNWCRSKLNLSLADSFYAVAIDWAPSPRLDYSTTLTWIVLDGEWFGEGSVELHVGPHLKIDGLAPPPDAKESSYDPHSYSWKIASGTFQHFHTVSLKTQDPRLQGRKEWLILLFAALLSLGASGLWETSSSASVRSTVSQIAHYCRRRGQSVTRLAWRLTRRRVGRS